MSAGAQHLLLFQAQQQGAGVEVEQLSFKQVSIWDAALLAVGPKHFTF